jgi:ribosomal RNA-processing protein 12
MACAQSSGAISTAKFCIQEIEKAGGGVSRPRASGEIRDWCRRISVKLLLCLPGSKEATTTLHMLTLLKDILPCFPEGLVKSCCETLLRVMTLSHVVSSGYRKEDGYP